MTGGGGGALADLAGAQRGLYSVHIKAASSCFLFTKLFPGNSQPQPFPHNSIKAVGRCSFQTYPKCTPGYIRKPSQNKSNVKYLSKTSSSNDLTGFASVPQWEDGSHAVKCCNGVRSPETPDWQQQQQRHADCSHQKGRLDSSRRTSVHVKAWWVFFFFFRRSDTFSVKAALSSFVQCGFCLCGLTVDADGGRRKPGCWIISDVAKKYCLFPPAWLVVQEVFLERFVFLRYSTDVWQHTLAGLCGAMKKQRSSKNITVF